MVNKEMITLLLEFFRLRKKKPMILYHIKGGPPSQSVLIVAKALEVDLELREIDHANEEYLAPWFLELNPTHTVPTLDDNGFVVWDSHAIICYLAENYGKYKSLYPQNTKQRAIVNQMLFLDCGTLFRRFSDVTRPIFYDGEKSIPQRKLDNLKETYIFLERILSKSTYLAGDSLTIADLSVIPTVSSSNVVITIEAEEFPKLYSWMEKMKTLPCYKAAVEGLNTFAVGYKIMTS